MVLGVRGVEECGEGGHAATCYQEVLLYGAVL